MPPQFHPTPRGYTLMELLAVVAIIGVVGALTIPRVSHHVRDGYAAACHANKGEIELQAQLWRRVNGAYPAANLAGIGADPNYFPEGLPTCPVDGSVYTIDATTGRVVGHTH